MKNKTVVTAIGGVAEIGSNMTLFEGGSQNFVIDCGILFPNSDAYSVNYLTPDFESIREKKIDTLIISHGHEDHIGAVCDLLDHRPKIKIHAPPFAKKLLERKLDERGIKKEVKLFRENDVIKVGEFTVHPVRVNHSIPDTFGLLVFREKQDWSLFFASDYKYDPDTPYEPVFNTDKIIKLWGQKKTRIFFSDSTNILSPGKTKSEKEVKEGMREVLSLPYSRIIVTMFASNVHRVQTVYDIAKDLGKQVAMTGRSLRSYGQVAEDLGYLNTRGIHTHYQNFPKKNVIIMATGSQGEPRGAMSRIASGKHRDVQLEHGDLVVFSSKVIPGNEKKIYYLFNMIAEMDVDLLTYRDANIHASGHPSQEDLKSVISLIKPTDYVPIHGESLFLKRHYEFIENNYPNKIKPHLLHNFWNFCIGENGDIEVKRKKDIPDPILYLDKGIQIERNNLRERAKIARDGIIVVTISQRKEIHIEMLGVPEECHGNYDRYKKSLEKYIRRDWKGKSTEDVRVNARIIFQRQFSIKPTCLVISESHPSAF